MKILDQDGLNTLVAMITAKLSDKADKATTLAGYKITDAYTKTEIDELIARLQESEEGHFFKAEENEF